MLLLQFLFFVLQPKSAFNIPGSSIAGQEFVFLIPYCGATDEMANIHINTQAMTSKVNVYYPVTTSVKMSKAYTVSRLRLPKFSSRSLSFRSSRLGNKYTPTKSGTYYAIHVQSYSVIRVFASGRCNLRSRTETKKIFFIEIVAKEGCHKIYHLNVHKGYPYAMIGSFDENNNIRVSFPSYSKKYKIDCEAPVQCASGTTLVKKLNQYQIWVFYLQAKGIDLHNTVMVSDFPIYVMAGNINCPCGVDDSHICDICLTHASPRKAWGKEYVVPYFFKSGAHIEYKFRINLVKFPLHYSVDDGKKVEAKVALKPDGFELHTLDGPVIISSKTPFGIALHLSSTPQDLKRGNEFAVLQNLIPFEQWRHGGESLLDTGPPSSTTYNMFIATTASNLVHPDFTQNQMHWEKISYTKRSLSFAYLSVEARTHHRFFSKEAAGVVMIYLYNNRMRLGATATAIDFYQGVLYPTKCRKSKPLASDGRDNDCDGRVDEEFKNKLDDDGDGSADEDFSMSSALGLSPWAVWGSNCDTFMCGKQLLSRHVRSCEFVPYVDGCHGIIVKCEPGGTCPLGCLTSGNCSLPKFCKNGTVLPLKCDWCEGAFSDVHCLTPCPEGWSGYDCNIREDPTYLDNGDDDDEDDEEDDDDEDDDDDVDNDNDGGDKDAADIKDGSKKGGGADSGDTKNKNNADDNKGGITANNKHKRSGEDEEFRFLKIGLLVFILLLFPAIGFVWWKMKRSSDNDTQSDLSNDKAVSGVNGDHELNSEWSDKMDEDEDDENEDDDDDEEDEDEDDDEEDEDEDAENYVKSSTTV